MSRTLILAPHEARFVTAILSGCSQAEAYRLAKFPRRGKPIDQLSDADLRKRASEIATKNTRVQDALAHAQAATKAALDITADDIVRKLERAYDVALSIDPPQTGGAVAAAMGIAKLCGLVIDRSEVNVIRNKPSPVPTKQLELEPDQWRKLFDPAAQLRHGGTHNDR